MDSNNDAWISSMLKLRHVSFSQTAVPDNETPSDDESDNDGNRTPVESTPITMVSLSDSCTDEDEGTPPENDKFHTPPERMMKDGVSTDEEDTPSKKTKGDELEEWEIVRTLLELKAGIYNADLEMALERDFGSKSCGLSSLGEGAKEGEYGKSAVVEMEIEGVISRVKVDDAGGKCMAMKKSGLCAEQYSSNREAELGELEIKGTSFREKDEMEEGVKKNVEKECGLSGVDSNNSERKMKDFSSESLELRDSGDDELKEGEDVNSGLSNLGEGAKEGEYGKLGGVEMEIGGVISREKVDDAGEKCMAVKKLGLYAEEYSGNREAELGELEIKGTSFREKDEMEGVKKNVEKECGLSGVDSNNSEREREDFSSESLELRDLGDDELKEGEDAKSGGVEIELKGLEEKVDDVVDVCLTVKNLESSGVGYRIRELEVLELGEDLTVMKQVEHQAEEDMDENVKREVGFIEIDHNNREMARNGIERESLCHWALAENENEIKEGEDGWLEGVEVEIEGLGSSEKLDDRVNESVTAKKSKLVRVGSRELELEVAKAEIKALGANMGLDEWFMMEEKYSFLRWLSDDDEVEEGEDVTSGVPGMVMVGSLGLSTRIADDHMTGEESVLMNLEQSENLYSNGKRWMPVVEKLEVDVSNVVISNNSEKAAVTKDGSSELDNNLGLDNNRDVKLVESGLEGDHCREYVADNHEERNSLNKFQYGGERDGLEKVVDENGGTANNIEIKEGVEVVKYIDHNAKSMNSCTRILPAQSIGQGEVSIAGEEDQAAEVDTHVEVGWTSLLDVLNRLANKERQTRKRKCCCEHTPKCCE